MDESVKLYRGEVFYFVASPLEQTDAYVYEPDGALVVQKGKIVEAGSFQTLSGRYQTAEVFDFSGKLIMPGFIDVHVHFPQLPIIGMYGYQLLDWLNTYTFPAEQAFASPVYARQIASCFIRELLKNGTTTCMAYATVHPTSVEALFSVASQYNMCILAGKVLMNRNAPQGLMDTTEQGERDSRTLIEKWHGNGRILYVITPRFAITSTLDQLKSVGRLHLDYPGTYIQTHLSENNDEIKSVLTLYPGYKDYLDVYERTGLLTDYSVFGHCIYLSDKECARIASAHAIIAHCPTSNLFLGSGLFNMQQANEYGIQVALGTDVGAGTSFSMFRTMGESYKIQQLNGYPISVLETYYKSTLGAAKALHLEDKIGSFRPGNGADFIVVDYASTLLQKERMRYLESRGQVTIENKLFGLQTLGDDRAVFATYIMGDLKYGHRVSNVGNAN